MKPLLKGSCLWLATLAAACVSLQAQYQSPRQYLKRLQPTQPAAAPAPSGLPPGPTVAPAPSATAAPTAADANKAAAEKQATLKRTIEFQRKRAEAGSASAQYTLGLRYVQGDGVEKNLAEGCKWLRASAKQDNVWAKKKLEELDKEFGPLPPDPVAKPEAPAAKPEEKPGLPAKTPQPSATPPAS